jgi:hypothetical protein
MQALTSHFGTANTRGSESVRRLVAGAPPMPITKRNRPLAPGLLRANSRSWCISTFLGHPFRVCLVSAAACPGMGCSERCACVSAGRPTAGTRALPDAHRPLSRSA